MTELLYIRMVPKSTENHKKFQLLEAECLDNEGIKYRNEYQYRRKIERENNGINESKIQARNRVRYHVTLIKGKTYKIINYEQYIVQAPVDFGYGKMLQPNGIHRTSYGRSRLKQGGCISIRGKPLINAYEHSKVIIRRESKDKKKLRRKKVANKAKGSLYNYSTENTVMLLNSSNNYFPTRVNV